MPIIYGCVVPHSPILLPTIGKEHSQSLVTTTQSFQKIRESLVSLQADTLVLIAAQDTHPTQKKYCLHMAPTYTSSFAEFGDLVTQQEYPSDPVLTSMIKQQLTEAGFPVVYSAEEHLDYSAGVPLYHVAKGLGMKIIALNPADVSMKKVAEFGNELNRILQSSDKRIVCIASGDLSHCLTRNENDEYGKMCEQFDADIVTYLKQQRNKKILQVKNETIRTVGACGMPAIALLLGILENVSCTQEVLSYEAPFGVGYLVAEFSF
ncbi:AmmeMemoRadiSam system protein B [Candidatus Uhrbacteria bacterium]|nr:AmmeMemoRadiSam system protein B [Candidatus Uhrbacteria bacterium]